MLYDNAQLSRAYLHAYLLTGENSFKKVCQETLDFVLREMTHADGGFYSSLDADLEGVEGKFYLWTLEEIQNLGLDPADQDLLVAAYGISPTGNFEGSNVLQRVLNDEELATQLKLPAEEIPGMLENIHAQMLVAREQRARPATDDKILTAWNALMMISFAEAGRYLKWPDYTEAASRNARFLLDELFVSGRLQRSWRAGRASLSAYLEDMLP